MDAVTSGCEMRPFRTLNSPLVHEGRTWQPVTSTPMAQTYKLAVIPGDGIGIEVTAEALKVLNAAVAGEDVTFEQTEYDLGARAYARTGERCRIPFSTRSVATTPSFSAQSETPACRREFLSAGCC